MTHPTYASTTITLEAEGIRCEDVNAGFIVTDEGYTLTGIDVGHGVLLRNDCISIFGADEIKRIETHDAVQEELDKHIRERGHMQREDERG